ncbi:hypothetical protein [Gloeobacter morelensis]|uniref:Uncharacterized protein n=1 Tax=Gloeobacter morelensis MG652769 TaxID=2781736 RepID=A0ABY3PPU8_9CYAN|nr:hypothetical protein [Gloeobacter morelensis]UFP95716.1 hypothetical protein ISF26_05640 [Gloeobacter morelensis MG652769]
MIPPLWVAGPVELTGALAQSYRRWGGEVRVLEDAPLPVLQPAGRIMWLARPDSASPATALFERCADLAPAEVPLTLPDSTAALLVLPLVLTARGVLYAEAIGVAGRYLWQPEPLSDKARQILYRFARGLVDLLEPLTPGVYMVYFAVVCGAVRFEKLIAHPDRTALVTLTSQRPDLFCCHWRCALGLPVVDLQVHRPTAAAFVGDWPDDLLLRAALEPEASLDAAAGLVLVQAPTLQQARSGLEAILGETETDTGR